MSIASELIALNGYILGAYDEINDKGGTVPQNKNMANLATAITSIPSGGGLGIPLEVDANGYVSRQKTSFTFTFPAEATVIDMHYSQGKTGLPFAFIYCLGLTSVDMSSVTSIIGMRAAEQCFAYCKNLTDADLSGLDTINGASACEYMFKTCTKLTAVDLSALRRATTDYAMSYMFSNCTSLKTLSFPSFDASVSTNGALAYMLDGCSGVTVHFPSSQQSTMGSWNNVTKGFGGSNTTVLFDL